MDIVVWLSSALLLCPAYLRKISMEIYGEIGRHRERAFSLFFLAEVKCYCKRNPNLFEERVDDYTPLER